MPKFDKRCKDCDNTFEYEGRHSEVAECPRCGSKHTSTVWLAASFPATERAKDPYDYLDGPIPDSKRIFSGPKVSSKTTT